MTDERSLLDLTVGAIEYDFREDCDDVQGNWDVKLTRPRGELATLTIRYDPFDDSPYPEATEVYHLVRVS